MERKGETWTEIKRLSLDREERKKFVSGYTLQQRDKSYELFHLLSYLV